MESLSVGASKKYDVIIGRLGRYISVTKGAKAVSIPKKIKIKPAELFFADIIFLFLFIL